MTVGVRVEGLRNVTRALRGLGLDVADLKDAFAAVSALGAQKVAARIPRRSGRLAGTARGNRAASRAVVTIGRATVPYAGAINYGWPARGISPAHFIAKADADIAPIAPDLFDQEIEKKARQRGLL